jgi:hypothetical protein
MLPAQSHGSDREFLSGYVGTLPPAQSDRAGTYFQRPEVRRLLALLEKPPVSTAQADAALAGTSTQLRDLLRLQLVREDHGSLRIGFPYFTADDMRRVHTVAARYVPSLVVAYKKNQTRFDLILRQYPMPGVDRRRLRFVLIAGMSLNWDALQLLLEQRYRQINLTRGDGWQYSFWASENTPKFSYRGLYWGSSTFPSDALNLTPRIDFQFSSFGDALSEPRMNLPDILALPPEQMTLAVRSAAQTLGLHDDAELNLNLKNVIGLFQGRDLGNLLFAMRRGASSREEICNSLPESGRSTCEAKLSLLQAIGYVGVTADGNYELSVPVLDVADKSMLDATLALSRSIIQRWLQDNYSSIRKDLSHLTAVKQGVPFPFMFTQIWHELFGLTTRELTEKDFIENPRSPSVIWQGSIPLVFRSDIYPHKFE